MTAAAALLRAPTWTALQWPGARVAILASGESLTPAQCEIVRAWRFAASTELRRVIVINTTYRLAPWADLLYACDAPWWDQYLAKIAAGEWEPFEGERWTQDTSTKAAARTRWIESTVAPGLGRRPGLIHQGGNGGYQAMNLAFQAGAKRLVLLGFDMRGGHWHGPHPAGLPNPREHLFKAWIKNFARMATDLAAESIEVINCTPDSALRAFPLRPLDETLT